MVSLSSLERNSEITKNHLKAHISNLIEIVSDVVKEETVGMSIFYKPIVRGLYNMVIRDNLKNMGRKSVEAIVEMCRSFIVNDVDMESDLFYNKLNELFPLFLEHDLVGRICKKGHKNFPRFGEKLKESFEWQVRALVKMLRVDSNNIESYADLSRAVYSSKKMMRVDLKQQINPVVQGFSIVEEDLNILNIPASRKLAYKVMVKSYLNFIDLISREMNDTYS